MRLLGQTAMYGLSRHSPDASRWVWKDLQVTAGLFGSVSRLWSDFEFTGIRAVRTLCDYWGAFPFVVSHEQP